MRSWAVSCELCETHSSMVTDSYGTRHGSSGGERKPNKDRSDNWHRNDVPFTCGICTGKHTKTEDASKCKLCAPHPCVRQKVVPSSSDCAICAPQPCIKDKFDAGKAALSQEKDCDFCHGPCVIRKEKDPDCNVCQGPCIMKDSGKDSDSKICQGPCAMKKTSGDCKICRGPCVNVSLESPKAVASSGNIASDCSACAPHPCVVAKTQKKIRRSKSVSFEKKCCSSSIVFDNIPDRL